MVLISEIMDESLNKGDDLAVVDGETEDGEKIADEVLRSPEFSPSGDAPATADGVLVRKTEKIGAELDVELEIAVEEVPEEIEKLSKEVDEFSVSQNVVLEKMSNVVEDFSVSQNEALEEVGIEKISNEVGDFLVSQNEVLEGEGIDKISNGVEEFSVARKEVHEAVGVEKVSNVVGEFSVLQNEVTETVGTEKISDVVGEFSVLQSEVLENVGIEKVPDGVGEFSVSQNEVLEVVGMEKVLGGVDEFSVLQNEVLEAEGGRSHPVEPEKVNCNDNAVSVSHIMRNYLYLRQGGAGGSGGSASGSSSGEERCRAMMEVVRKDNGRWSVSKVILEHSHNLNPPADPAGLIASGGLLPVVGMEFDSVSAVKAYYGAYSGKMGFQMKMGSGKRSRGNRILIMQRFSCSKGYFPLQNNSVETVRKRKRGADKMDVCVGKETKENEIVEVIDVDAPLQKDGLIGGEKQGDSQIGLVEKGTILEVGKGLNTAGLDKGKGKIPLVSNPSQSRLLRDLGIKVSKYTNEERRDIILKYMQKKGNRQVVDRSAKVPSRQALAERRQRGVGGKFLSREEMQTANRQEEATEEEPELPEEVVANAGGVPIVGMVFENEDKAYDYYIKYAGTIGFSVRKGWWVRSSKSVTRSRVYVCSREGFRPNNDGKRPRPETRTGCPARMAIKITSSGKYRIAEFVADHNHQLAAPLDIQMLNSQKLLLKIQPSDRQTASLIPVGYKNYIRAKRSREVQSRDIGVLLEYFQKMKGDNPSFYYGIQVDEYDQITNIFWADAKSIMDYHHFGDVVCFDTSYVVNDYGRPLSLFLGVNHHKQTIIFAAAFLYDESVESYKWLFETFKTAMDDKQPKTIVTDRSAVINDAIVAVWPGTVQELCLWQIYQNAYKQLGHVFEASETFAHDLSQCIYDFEDEEEFLLAWKFMLEKYELKDNEWLSKLFEEKEKWALAYAQQTFHADIKSTLRSENLSTLLKEILNPEKDLWHFLKLFEMLLEDRRCAELQSDYNASQLDPRIPPLQLLWQAANVYTPEVFEVFRRELDLCMRCIVYSGGDVGSLSEYQVTVKERNRSHYVRFDSADGSIICSCRKFESIGILCCHALKVLDLRNIKELPSHYFLKRWRKDAKAGNLREDSGIMLDSDPKSSISKRYNSLCRNLFKIAAKAAENEDTFMLMVSQSDQLLEQVERILQRTFIEKQSLANSSKALQQNANEIGSTFHDNGIEAQKVGGKKRSNGAMRRRQQSEMGVNRKPKDRKGQTDDGEVVPRDDEPHPTPSSMSSQPRNPSNQYLAPSHFMQGHFFPHQFGLGTAQGFPPMTQFGQDSSSSAIQQQFHGHSSMTQGFPTPNALQFVGSNSQLDPQSSDQGQCSIPVWDFL